MYRVSEVITPFVGYFNGGGRADDQLVTLVADDFGRLVSDDSGRVALAHLVEAAPSDEQASLPDAQFAVHLATALDSFHLLLGAMLDHPKLADMDPEDQALFRQACESGLVPPTVRCLTGFTDDGDVKDKYRPKDFDPARDSHAPSHERLPYQKSDVEDIEQAITGCAEVNAAIIAGTLARHNQRPVIGRQHLYSIDILETDDDDVPVRVGYGGRVHSSDLVINDDTVSIRDLLGPNAGMLDRLASKYGSVVECDEVVYHEIANALGQNFAGMTRHITQNAEDSSSHNVHIISIPIGRDWSVEAMVTNREPVSKEEAERRVVKASRAITLQTSVNAVDVWLCSPGYSTRSLIFEKSGKGTAEDVIDYSN